MKSNTFNFSFILSRFSRFFGVLSIAALMMSVIAMAQPYSNPDPVDLGAAGNYRALAGTALNIGAGCSVNGNVGGTSVTNGGTVTGTTDIGNPAYGAAIGALTLAINTTTLRTPDATFAAVELGGLNLGRGVYAGPGTFGINSTLTLTGTATDIFIFQMTTTLITGTGCHVILSGGALASNVFWQVGSAATIDGDFKGIILAKTYITQNTGTIDGGSLGLTAVTLNGTSVLPVELTSFTAKLNNGAVELNWNTSTEVNNFGFEVQRSQTSNVKSETLIFNWTKIGFVNGAGLSNSPKNYLFVDKTVSYGSYAYRLKQIDSDGNYKYSSVTEVNAGQLPKGYLLTQNYPNPFNPSTLIQFSISKNTHATLTIFNVIGGKVAMLFDGNAVAGQVYNVTFNGYNLASGIYYYKLQTNEITEVKKMLFMK
jgi:hypothetical protein